MVNSKRKLLSLIHSLRDNPAIPQADRSADGEDDLVARVVGFSVVAMHSSAVHLDHDAAVRNLADLGNYRVVPFIEDNYSKPGNVADITSQSMW